MNSPPPSPSCAENIKVRRAGFAYRNDFHRFLDRFGILSPTTYPEWRGTDLVSGCGDCSLCCCVRLNLLFTHVHLFV